MNYKIILTILLSLHIFSSSSQNAKSFFITTEVQSKFSIGTPSRDIIGYSPDIVVNVPKVSKFRNPVYGIDISLNYILNKRFSAGIGVGLNIAKHEYNPTDFDEYYDKVMIPVYFRLNYELNMQKEWMLLSNVNIGYQFSDQNFNNTANGFILEEKGGVVTGINFGAGKKDNRFSPYIKLGYEFNCFNNEHSLVDMGFQDINYSDKIEYRRYYHLLKLTIGIKI